MSKTKILLIGYSERGNLGDDAMRDALIAWLRTYCDAEVRSVSLPEWNASGVARSLHLLRAFRWADITVLAGGTHFQDGFGVRSHRILSTMLLLFAAARACGARVALAGVGVGPLRSRAGRLLSRLIFQLSSVVLVRDRPSAAIVRRLSPATRLAVGFDVAILLDADTRTRSAIQRTLGISLVPYFTAYEGDPARDVAVANSLARALAACQRRDPSLSVCLLALHRGSRANDLHMADSLASYLRANISTEVVVCKDHGTLLQEITTSRFLIATRYHAALFGYYSGVPMLVVAYEEKCRALAAQVGLSPHAILTPHDLLNTQLLYERFMLLFDEPDLFRARLAVFIAKNEAHAGLFEFSQRLAITNGEYR